MQQSDLISVDSPLDFLLLYELVFETFQTGRADKADWLDDTVSEIAHDMIVYHDEICSLCEHEESIDVLITIIKEMKNES